MPKQVKITVLKKLRMDDLIEEYIADKAPSCPRFEVGDVIITDGSNVPEGFCAWAWSDIYKDILLVRQEAKCRTKDGKGRIACCTDGLRPVFFLIEPYQD